MTGLSMQLAALVVLHLSVVILQGNSAPLDFVRPAAQVPLPLRAPTAPYPPPAGLTGHAPLVGVNHSVASSQTFFDPLAFDPWSRAYAHRSRLSFVVMSETESQSPSIDGQQTTSQAYGSSSSSSSSPNRAFEINRPTRIVVDRDHVRPCSVTILQHSFTNSYGKPAVASYSPNIFDDDTCKDASNWVFLELTMNGYGKGRQFDRLGSVQLDGVEVLRTDNQEPSVNGTVWSFTKEMTQYFDLFRTERSLLFDFPNIVNDVYVSPLDTSLVLTAYVAVDGKECALPPLSRKYPVILPLSKRSITANSFFTLGDAFDDEVPSDDNAGITRLAIPRNARAALVEVYASGTAQDEFWYTNLPNDQIDRLGGTAANVGYPRGPLREIQVLIDGQLAGVALPFPVIFTGGISPFLWRPQVAFGAFDQPTYIFDVTPFLPLLTDDKEHEFSLKVVSAEQNQTVLGWFVSGNVQVYLDQSDQRTTGHLVRVEAPGKGSYSVTSFESGNVSDDGILRANVRTTEPRTVYIEALLKPGSSPAPYTVTWSQSMTFDSQNEMSGNKSSTSQDAQGFATSVHGAEAFLSYRFSYPLNLTSIGANYTLEHGYHLNVALGNSIASTVVRPASQRIDMTQNGEAVSIVGDNPQQLIGGFGSTFTSYSYEDADGRTFSRDNSVSNQTVTHDEVRGTLSSKASPVRA